MRAINRDFEILIILSKRWIEELSQFCNSCLIISLGDPVKSTTQGINDRYFMWNPLCSRIMWIIGLLHVLIGPNMWNTLKFVLPQFYGKLCRSSNFLNSPLLLLKIKIVFFFPAVSKVSSFFTDGFLPAHPCSWSRGFGYGDATSRLIGQGSRRPRCHLRSGNNQSRRDKCILSRHDRNERKGS